LFADVNLHGHVVGPTPEGVELFSDSEKDWFCNYHTSLVAAIVLRYAQGRCRQNVRHSLEQLESSQMKLSTLFDVGSIFRRIASGEITPSGAQYILLERRDDFGPELAARIEHHVRTLAEFI
jgi:hypothetical protein